MHRIAPVAALLALLAMPGAASARPTHGTIEPLAADADLDGRDYDPVQVGRGWYLRDNTGVRYFRSIVAGATVLGRGAPHPIMQAVTRELYRIDGDKLHLMERVVLDAGSPDGIALVGLAATDDAQATGIAEKPAVEMPRHIRAGLTWSAGTVPAKVLGLADVTVAAGDYPGCLVIEQTGGFTLADGTKADVRRFYAPKVGEVFTTVMISGAWRPAMELESSADLPTNATTMQPAPKP